ncbi:MAG: hypothetical protein M1166_05270 [Candidatus Thermoplasmatota archaeon]|nr:hypothetical protein [Candidatus Thermoplasmatota archaeon]
MSTGSVAPIADMSKLSRKMPMEDSSAISYRISLDFAISKAQNEDPCVSFSIA